MSAVCIDICISVTVSSMNSSYSSNNFNLLAARFHTCTNTQVNSANFSGCFGKPRKQHRISSQTRLITKRQQVTAAHQHSAVLSLKAPHHPCIVICRCLSVNIWILDGNVWCSNSSWYSLRCVLPFDALLPQTFTLPSQHSTKQPSEKRSSTIDKLAK